MKGIKGTVITVLALSSLTACVNKAPVLHGETLLVTEAPEQLTEEPVEVQTAAPTEAYSGMDMKDELGNQIVGDEHFKQYLTFKNLIVYDEDGDTFLDGIIKNDYVKPIACAVDIVYRDGDGTEVARARLQTKDGMYMLMLEPGETTILARILTDMKLSGREYEMEFDDDIGVKPVY